MQSERGCIEIAGLDSFVFDNEGILWKLHYNEEESKMNDNIKIDTSDIPSIKQMSSILASGTSGYLYILDVEGNLWLPEGDSNILHQLENQRNFKRYGNDIPFVDVSSKTNFLLALDIDGNVWSCGRNTLGELGNGSFISAHEFTRISSISKIVSISAGGQHSLFLDSNGVVWGCGSDFDYQLFGNGSSTNRPLKLTGLPKISKIEASSTFHSLFLDCNGNVWGRGRGNGLPKYCNLKEKIISENLPCIIDIFSGENSTFLLDEERTVWVIGLNKYGELGLGHKHPQTTFCSIPNIPPIRFLTTGKEHTLFIDELGKVWGCGSSARLTLGVNFDEVLEPIELDVPYVTVNDPSSLKKSARNI